MSTAEILRELLDDLDYCELECDGFTHCAAYRLSQAGIPFKVYAGPVEFHGESLPLHFWIVVDDKIVDYRLRMWFGPDAPHGVSPRSKSAVNYSEGEHVSDYQVISPFIYSMLSGN